MEKGRIAQNRMVVVGLAEDVSEFIRRAKSQKSDLDLNRLLPIPVEELTAGSDLGREIMYVRKQISEHWGNLGFCDVSSSVANNYVTMAVTYRFNIIDDNPNYCPNLEWLVKIAKDFPNLRFDLYATRGKLVWTAACSGGFKEKLYVSPL